MLFYFVLEIPCYIYLLWLLCHITLYLYVYGISVHWASTNIMHFTLLPFSGLLNFHNYYHLALQIYNLIWFLFFIHGSLFFFWKVWVYFPFFLTSSRFETNIFSKESPYFEDPGWAPMLCNAGCVISIV